MSFYLHDGEIWHGGVQLPFRPRPTRLQRDEARAQADLYPDRHLQVMPANSTKESANEPIRQ